MRRRELLAALGTASAVGGAGCISIGSAGCVSVGTETPETRRRTVSIDAVDEVTDEHRVAIDVALLEAEITDEHTARLRVTATNEGPPRWFSVRDSMCAILNRTDEMSDPEGVWLYRTEETRWLEREGKKWEHDGDPDEPRGYATYGCGTTLFESGDSVPPSTSCGTTTWSTATSHPETTVGRCRFARGLTGRVGIPTNRRPSSRGDSR